MREAYREHLSFYLGEVKKHRPGSSSLAATGKVWDLMPWGFHADAKELASTTEPTLFYSTEVDLKQQISSIIAQGGGLEPYYIPTMTGAIDPRLTRTVAGLAAYARARQAGHVLVSHFDLDRTIPGSRRPRVPLVKLAALPGLEPASAGRLRGASPHLQSQLAKIPSV